MKYKRLRDIVIELTSLLDVVMILIFAVMIENNQLTKQSQAKLAEANKKIEEMSGISEEYENLLGKLDKGELEELLAKLEGAKSRNEAYEYMENVVSVVNVGLENEYNNTARVLTFGTGNDEISTNEIKRTSVEEWNNAINKLKIYLNEYITNRMSEEEKQNIYLVFSVNYSRVYSNDFESVENALIEMAEKYDNVIYQVNELSEEAE